MPEAAAPRTASLDNLRGLATLLVTIQLCAEVLVFRVADADVTSWPRIAIYDFSLTYTCIPLFFLTSGYFIPASFRSPHPVRNFAIKRMLRLYPVFLVAALFALALLPFEFNVPASAGHVVRSFVLMDPLAPATPFSRLHWVLMVMLLFYAMCIVASLVGCIHARVYPSMTIFILLVVLSGMIVIGKRYHQHFPIATLLSLILAYVGTSVRELEREINPRARAKQGVLLIAFACAIPLISHFAWSTAMGAGEFWIGRALGYALAMALFFAYVFVHLPISRALTALSIVSYPLFFFLPLTIAFAASRLTSVPLAERPLPLALVVAVAFALAALTHRFVEVPVTRWRNRLLATS